MTLDSTTLSVLSDISANLAAAWFGVAVVVPAGTKRKINPFLLAMNVEYGILYLLIAVILAKKATL